MIFRWIAALSALIGAVCGCFGGLWRGIGGFCLGFLGLTALAFAFLGTVCALVDTSKPQEEDSPFYRAVMYPYIEMLMQLSELYGVTINDILKAETAGIKFQKEILLYGGTDTSAMQLVGSGSKAGALSIPTRYIHSPSEMCDLADVEACSDLAVAFITECK